MNIRGIPFVITEWGDVAQAEHPGEAGTGDLEDSAIRRHPGSDGQVYGQAMPQTTGASKGTLSIAWKVNCAPNSRTDERSRCGLA